MTQTVPRSAMIAGLAVAGSLVAHLAALAWPVAPDPVEIEGGGAATLAMAGTSFADMAQGRSDAVSPEGVEAVHSTARTPSVVTTAVETVAPPVAPPAPAESVPAVEPIPVVPAIAPPATPPVRTPVDALDAVGSPTTPRLSSRPRSRPETVVAQAAARRAEEAKRAPAPSEQPARRGNAAVEATRGASGGSDAAQATSSGQGRAQAAGNAAASNYPGRVQARIQRQRMPRGAGRGTARVAFTVAPSGALATLGLAASSGSATLDKAALGIVQRAAPFPAPPPGAQVAYVIPVQGR